MVNSSEFIERLEHLFQHYSLTASAFADTIQVQRSSISHLLSGRNKPSLEFVLKVVKNFPEVNLYWLLNGKGSFPAEDKEEGSPEKKGDSLSPETSTTTHTNPDREVRQSEKCIDRIVIFYSDGSFESFENG